jgi:hypothetical protein
MMNIDDLTMLRSTLQHTVLYLEATDLANAQMNLDDVRYRPLTEQVQQALNRVEGLIADALMERYKEDNDAPSERDVEDHEPEDGGAGDNPGTSGEEGEQLSLFDPAEYEAPPAVTAARRKYRMLADE